MVSKEFIRQLEGYGLTTATILYHMPDHPALLQSYVWQEYDLAPKFPVLLDFLDFWKRELDGPVHSVTVAHSRLDQAGRVPEGRWGPDASLKRSPGSARAEPSRRALRRGVARPLQLGPRADLG